MGAATGDTAARETSGLSGRLLQDGSNVRPAAHDAVRLERRPRQSFETWSWFFMRVSGLVLVILALGHFSITHFINDVAETDSEFVGERWDNVWWRLYDWALLTLALLHGLNGLRTIMDDYIRSAPKRAAAKSILYLLSGFLLFLGTFSIVTFDAGGEEQTSPIQRSGLRASDGD